MGFVIAKTHSETINRRNRLIIMCACFSARMANAAKYTRGRIVVINLGLKVALHLRKLVNIQCYSLNIQEVTLINGQMPKHFLTVPHIGYCENAYSISGGSYTRSTPTSEKQGLWQEDSGSFMSHKFSFGNNEAHSNLQPYSTIYMWRRTAQAVLRHIQIVEYGWRLVNGLSFTKSPSAILILAQVLVIP